MSCVKISDTKHAHNNENWAGSLINSRQREELPQRKETDLGRVGSLGQFTSLGLREELTEYVEFFNIGPCLRQELCHL